MMLVVSDASFEDDGYVDGACENGEIAMVIGYTDEGVPIVQFCGVEDAHIES